MNTSLSSRRWPLVAGVALLMLVIAFFGRRLAVQQDSPLSCIVEDHRTGGGAGIRDWAERLGHVTLPLRQPVWEIASELPQTGSCVISAGNEKWNPFGEDDPAAEWRTLSRWVAAGNSLLLITTSPRSLPQPVFDYFTNTISATGTVPSFDSDAEKSKSDSQTANSESDGKDSDSLAERIRLDPGNKRVDAQAKTENVPAWWGGEMAIVDDCPRLRNAPAAWVQAGTADAAVLVRRKLGGGTVYLLLDGTAWTNAGFDRADNAATLARVLRDAIAPGGILAFDEYRHGRGRVESFATFFLSLPGSASFTWIAVIIGLFWLWGRNQRLGPPEEYRETERRTAREYIESVATLYRRARAPALAVEAVAQRVRFLARRKGQLPTAAAQLCERAERHARQDLRSDPPKAELQFVRELMDLRKAYYGTRPDSRAD